MEIDYDKLFLENCFQPAKTIWLCKLSEILCEKGALLVLPLIKTVELFLSDVMGLVEESNEMFSKEQGHLREETNPIQSVFVPFYTISISFLRTSLDQGEPIFLLEAYLGKPFHSPSFYEKEVDASWLFPDWEHFKEELSKRAVQEQLDYYIQKPQRESYESIVVQNALSLAYFYLKYAIRALENRPIWKKQEVLAEKNYAYMITFGEYMDWQIPIEAIKPPIDILLYKEAVDLTYRTFTEKQYEENIFFELILDNSVFERCHFYHCHIKGSSICDVRFIECTFVDCSFEKTQCMGTFFISSHLEQVKFKDCVLDSGSSIKDGINYIYASAQFKQCDINQMEGLSSNTTENIFIECTIIPKEENIQ